MKTQLFSAALALATLTTASTAFAGDGWSLFRRNYDAPVYKPEPRNHEPRYQTQTEPRYQTSDYRTTRGYDDNRDDNRDRDVYRPRPRTNGY